MKQEILVKLKMKKIYKSTLTFIGFLICLFLAIGIMYFFYHKYIDDDSDIEVLSNLSINYIDSKKIEVEDKKNISFTVTNGSENTKNFIINFKKIRGSGNYKVTSEDEELLKGKLNTIDEISTSEVSLNANETKSYIVEIENTGDILLTGTINVKALDEKTSTFKDLILNDNNISEDALTKVGTEVAIENEGLIKSNDDIGTTYYFRGNITNNYVSFGNILWRIVRINGDSTVRLVLDNVTDVVSNYYINSESFEYNKSNINTYLEMWLQDNLNNYTEYIANTKYCSDIIHDENYLYSAYTRIVVNKIPSINCLGLSFSNDIGLLTIDEVIFAGASPNANNNSYYLYNNSITDTWYTMTGARGNSEFINMFMIDQNGNIKTDVTGNLYRGVRPVINLVKNIKMEGKGTIEDPYRISE